MEQLRISKEQAEAASKAKSGFIANVSHDIRTPLTGLIGMANILARELKNTPNEEAVNGIVMAGNALLDFLNKVIEFSKLEAGELPVYEVKFSMKSLIENIVALVTPSIQEKGLKLTVNCDDNIPVYLIGDSTRIDRILLNLVGNAIKFTHRGFVEISVGVAKQQGQKSVLRITVKDSGIGIPKEKQEIIFSKFGKLNPSYAGTYKGYGLGLSIVKQFVSEIDGEIYVKSEEGEGSTFICIIPLRESLLEGSENEATLPQHTAIESHLLQVELRNQVSVLQNKSSSHVITEPAVQDNSQVKRKILLVEDNELAQKVAKHQLDLLNCQVDTADTGEKALELSQKNKYDLIFMDIGLPGKNGIETATEIRKFEASTGQHVPIVALTAHIDKDGKQVCLVLVWRTSLLSHLANRKL